MLQSSVVYVKPVLTPCNNGAGIFYQETRPSIVWMGKASFGWVNIESGQVTVIEVSKKLTGLSFRKYLDWSKCYQCPQLVYILL